MLVEEEQRTTDQLAEEEDSLLEVEEVADQLVVDERQGEFVISVLGEVNNYVAVNSTSSV